MATQYVEPLGAMAYPNPAHVVRLVMFAQWPELDRQLANALITVGCPIAMFSPAKPWNP